MSENYSPQSFRYLPPVVKNLLIINIIVYLADMTLGGFGIDLTRHLGLHYVMAERFFPTQYFTYLFMHANFGHLFFNMFALWMFGYTLENYWGSKRFLFYYLFCGVGAGLIQNIVIAYEVWNLTQEGIYHPVAIARFMNHAVTIGASGAVFGILLAFGMMWPNMRIYLYFLLPIKAKYFVVFYGLLELFSGISGASTNIAHFAHLGGMLFGFILIMWWRKRYRNDFYSN
ncbi:MAG: rhomboid family intramembrane serine protease [Bacteroidales bacterium]|jgi:membrane associated rhomboid family serine protease|nr:rhomboid family intramembrane serine protease [Bacteroidales bacterium]